MHKLSKQQMVNRFLHFRDADKTFGDTHQFYNEKDGKWYMIYLVRVALPDIFVTRQLSSDDMIHWQRVNFNGVDEKTTSELFFNDILKANGDLLTWVPTREPGKVGTRLDCFYLPQGFTAPTEGWQIGPEKFVVWNDAEEYYGGLRDYSVFYDAEEKKYYCLAIAYHDYAVWGYGTKVEPFLVMFESESDAPCNWSKKAKRLMEFDLSVSGDPECCHMGKIGERWYLFASPAGFSYRYMGKFTYWFSKPGEKLKDIDWNLAEKRELTGVDLCAGKVSFGKNGEPILYGWIPEYWDDSVDSERPIEWGGSMSFPYILSQNEDGTLNARFVDSFAKAIRGHLILEKKQIKNYLKEILIPNGGMDMDILFSNNDSGKINVCFKDMDEKNEFSIIVDANDHTMTMITNGRMQTKIELPREALKKENRLQVVVENDIVEICLNDCYILPAKACFSFQNRCIIEMIADFCEESEQSIRIYHLRTPDEID